MSDDVPVRVVTLEESLEVREFAGGRLVAEPLPAADGVRLVAAYNRLLLALYDKRYYS